MKIRLTARARLTVLYSVLFALSGAAVATLIIVLSFLPTTPAISVSKPNTVVDKSEMRDDGSSTVDQVTAAKQQARAEFRARLVGGAVIGVSVLTVVSAGLGWLVAGRVLRPVHVVSGTARRLSEQNLHERIPVSGPDDEMRELAETFNGMLARLQRSFDAQSHFAANASHELRGPMTTQRTLIEVAAAGPGASGELRELARALHPVLDRQERLVDGLLALAWSEHGTTTIEPVRLDELARASLRRTGHDGLTVDARLRPATVPGDPVLLDLLVDNLVRNAVRHNVPGGQVWLDVGEHALVVANTGEQVGPARLAELFEPFRRGDRDRIGAGGAGLGLAIVTAVARAHRARVSLDPRPGGGIRIEVRFPDHDTDPAQA